MTTQPSSKERDLSPRGAAALRHLRNLRPTDGYAAETYLSTSGERLVRLNRRGVPLRDEGFIDLVVPILGTGSGDGGRGCVVGIEVATTTGAAGRGVVLVDRTGSPVSPPARGEKRAAVTVDMKDVLTMTPPSVPGSGRGSSDTRQRSPSTRSSASSTSFTAAPGATLNGENDEFVKYGLMVIGGLVVLKIISAALNILLIMLVPLAYIYASQNCPSVESFDAKKELKRVMRGAHLPEEKQPQGFFEGAFNRLQASISTELATSLGYEVSITDYLGAARMATVRVPVANADFYWIGIFNKWRFVGQREIPDNKTD